MKLGFWNRLAIVASGITLLVAPIAVGIYQNKALQEQRQVNYDLCMKIANDLWGDGDAKVHGDALQSCWNTHFPKHDTGPSAWDEWRVAFMATAFVCLVIYLMIWSVYAVSRWVWRGRWA